MERSVMMAPHSQVKLALLASLGVFAIVAFASANLRAQSAATNPAQVASISDHGWSPAQQRKLDALMTTYAKQGPLNSSVTNALGLTTGNTILSAPSLTYTFPSLPSILHAICPLPGGETLVVLQDQVAHVTFYYRLDTNLKLVAAVSRGQNQLPISIPVADAERNVAAELQVWAEVIADQH